MAAGLGLFAAILLAALAARVRPSARGARLLDFFGVAGDPSVALGDLLGVAGFTGALALLAAERAGYPIDAVLLGDAALSALGLGVAVTWLLDRLSAPAALELALAEAPRALITEVDPREPGGDAGPRELG